MAAEFKRTACRNLQRLSKPTVLANFEEGTTTGDWLRSLEDSQWSIVSFNPNNREVCININDNVVEVTVSLTLPLIKI